MKTPPVLTWFCALLVALGLAAGSEGGAPAGVAGSCEALEGEAVSHTFPENNTAPGTEILGDGAFVPDDPFDGPGS